MKFIITEKQYSFLIEQRSDFAMDRQSNAILRSTGIRSKNDYNTVNQVIKSASTTNIDPHTLMTILAIGTAFIPVAGPFISAGIGLADASMYYQEGDKKTAGITAALSMLPFIGSVVSKIPGVKQLGAKGMAALASKLNSGSKLSQAEVKIVNAIKANETLVKQELTSASTKLSPVVESIKSTKPQFISRFGQQKYNELLEQLLSGKITKEQFLNTIGSSKAAAPELANFATKFGIKFSQQELQSIENLSKNILSGKPNQIMLANGKDGLKKVTIALMDSNAIAKSSPQATNALAFKMGEDMIIINKEKIAGKTLNELQELIGHEMAHIKDPSMVSSKLSSKYVKGSQQASLKNYDLHPWEINAVSSASIQNLTNTTKSWMKYLPKEQLVGYMDEIINFAKGTQKTFSKPILNMIGNDGVQQMNLLYRNDKKGYIEFMKKMAQQASYLKSQLNVAM